MKKNVPREGAIDINAPRMTGMRGKLGSAEVVREARWEGEILGRKAEFEKAMHAGLRYQLHPESSHRVTRIGVRIKGERRKRRRIGGRIDSLNQRKGIRRDNENPNHASRFERRRERKKTKR